MIPALLIVSVFLSTIGGIFYKIFAQNRLSFHQEKRLIYIIVIFSLLAPVAGYYVVESTGLTQSSYIISAITDNQNCDKEDILAECKRIEADGGFCDCEEILAQNIVAYKSNQFYEWAAGVENSMLASIWIFGILLITLLIVRFGYLLYLIAVSPKKYLVVEGVKSTVLLTKSKVTVGSFKIFNNYIIWNPQLDSFSAEEKMAIMLHEISHLKQRNTWELIVLSLIQILWFMNPVFYLLKAELVNISEYIADEFAVNKSINKKQYANLLLRVHESNANQLISNYSKSNLKSRIKQLVATDNRKHRSFSFVFASMIFVMSISATFAMSLMAAEQHTLEAYHILKQKNTDTGRTLFCKDCIEYPSF